VEGLGRRITVWRQPWTIAQDPIWKNN
jgi:hypothetical protein